MRSFCVRRGIRALSTFSDVSMEEKRRGRESGESEGGGGRERERERERRGYEQQCLL